MSLGTIEDAKKVETYDHKGNVNGSLAELFKDGEKTVAYLTSTKPGMFKGYHLHRVRAARYVPLQGKMKIVLFKPGTKEKEEYVLDAQKPQRLFIPKDIATGLLNIGDEEAFLINYPDPPYDPSLKDEQVEYTEEELLQGIVK
ncbi:MAG: WxcM-like domain-containing protein [Candidatus Levybacteria bacterium]|nr:WxcM-like domain-containing protein [Candidatus Levybacteria bacterium]